MIRSVLKWIAIAVAAVVAVVFAIALWPTSTSALSSHPAPVGSYAAAVTAFEQVRADDRRESTIPVCYSRLLTHGEKAAKAIVLVHGLTNCPAQFRRARAGAVPTGLERADPASAAPRNRRSGRWDDR